MSLSILLQGLQRLAQGALWLEQGYTVVELYRNYKETLVTSTTHADFYLGSVRLRLP